MALLASYAIKLTKGLVPVYNPLAPHIFVKNEEDFFVWLGYGCALALAKLFSFSKLKLNAHKINNKSDYGDLHKLEEIFINFQGVISTREDI